MEKFSRIEGLLHHGVDTFSIAQYEFTFKNRHIYIWYKHPYDDLQFLDGEGWSFIEKPNAFPVGHYVPRSGYATLDDAIKAAVERISLVSL